MSQIWRTYITRDDTMHAFEMPADARPIDAFLDEDKDITILWELPTGLGNPNEHVEHTVATLSDEEVYADDIFDIFSYVGTCLLDGDIIFAVYWEKP